MNSSLLLRGCRHLSVDMSLSTATLTRRWKLFPKDNASRCWRSNHCLLPCIPTNTVGTKRKRPYYDTSVSSTRFDRHPFGFSNLPHLLKVGRQHRSEWHNYDIFLKQRLTDSTLTALVGSDDSRKLKQRPMYLHIAALPLINCTNSPVFSTLLIPTEYHNRIQKEQRRYFKPTTFYYSKETEDESATKSSTLSDKRTSKPRPPPLRRAIKVPQFGFDADKAVRSLQNARKEQARAKTAANVRRALFGNLIICASKFGAWLSSGSSSMMSEFVYVL